MTWKADVTLILCTLRRGEGDRQGPTWFLLQQNGGRAMGATREGTAGPVGGENGDGRGPGRLSETVMSER